MSSEYIYEIDQSNNKELISQLIKKINKWSNSLPHHPFKNFGDKIKVESLHYTPAYPVLLDSQFEKRTKNKQYIPYDNRKIPERKFFGLDEIKVWEWNLKSFDKYTDDEFNYFATGSEHVEDCHQCNAKGWITCTQCHGEKQITCPTCNGTGKSNCKSCGGNGYESCSKCHGSGKTYTQCSTCGGSGLVKNDGSFTTSRESAYVNCPTCYGNKQIESSCYSCGGSGKTTCRSCGGSGKITCSTCNGNGKITCPKCNGSGKNTCPTCQGKQQLLHYFNIKQTLSTNTQEAAMLHQKISAKFPEFKDNWSNYDSELIFNVRKDKITLDNLPKNTHLDSLFKRHLEKADALCDNSQKILFQDLDIRKIDVWLLNYTFEGRTYYFTFYGKNHTIIPGSNPISEFSSKLVNEAYQAAKSRSYVKAYRTTKKSKDIGIYEQKNIVTNQLAKLREKIAEPYLLGGNIGGMFAALIIGCIALTYFKNINFVLPWAEFINRPTNFLFNIHPWAMSIVTAWLIYKTGKSSGKLANKIFGVRKGSYLRLSLGIITALILSTLTVGIILLINTTGITIVLGLLGWLGYWVLKIILMIIGLIIGFFIWLLKLIF